MGASHPLQRISKFFLMENPFKSGDKVLTKIKGQQVEAIVNQVYNQEVQVRTADKKLLWRTVKTVTLVEAAVIPPAGEPEKPVATTSVTPPPLPEANTDSIPANKEPEKPTEATPPPLPSAKYSEGSEETPNNEHSPKSAKYKRSRSLFPKRKKI